MDNTSNNKPVYDLEERTYLFAKNVRQEMKKVKKYFFNEDDIRQLIRSSGSVGANYIEANESFSKKDFVHRIKICRKESKESAYWLRLINDSTYENNNKDLKILYQEAVELKKIFSSIIEKSK
ncbi:MAG: four helix bundle protein [Bacteroidales bacterium]|nr:four helix bundle protein [Bacteroidales bacterium]